MSGILFALTKRHYHYPFLLTLLGLLIFSSVLFKGFILDDTSQIITNTAVHSLSSVPSFFTKSLHYEKTVTTLTGFTYRPITYATYAFLYALGSGSPFAFHLFLLLLYLANVVLVYILFSKFTRHFIAFLAALLFLIHPANQEIVTYIADIQDALYFFFGISALIVVMSNIHYKKQVLITTMLLLLACLSKETGLLFIIAVPLYLFLSKKKLLKTYVLSIGAMLVLYFVLRINAGLTPFLTIVVPQTSTMPLLSGETHLLLIPKMLFYYLSTIVMPLPALPITFLNSMHLLTSLLSFIAVVCVYSGALFVARLLKRAKHKQIYNGYVFFFCLFLVSTFFHSQIIPLDVLVSKRWIYVQLFAFLGMLCCVVTNYYPTIVRQKHLLIGFYVLYVLILFAETALLLQYY